MQFEILPSTKHVSAKFSGILLDAYGVFWGGNEIGLFPGAKEAMEQFVLEGKVVGILSNTTQLAAKETNKLRLHGLLEHTHFHFLVTSGEVARKIFLHENLPFKISKNKFWLFGGVHPKFSSHEPIFKDTRYGETPDINEADFIYISIPHINGEDQTDPELFRGQVLKIKDKNLPMVCTNPDLFAHEGKPSRAVVRQGSIAKMYEEMGGKVLYIGKPHSSAFSTAFDHFKQYNIADSSKILMVGDTPETDIRGANAFGISTALIVETGIMSNRIAHYGFEKSIQALSRQDTPNYLLRGL